MSLMDYFKENSFKEKTRTRGRHVEGGFRPSIL